MYGKFAQTRRGRLVRKGPERLVRFFEFFPYLDMLRTVLLAGSAFHTLRRKSGCCSHSDISRIFKPSFALALRIHLVIAGKSSRDIDTLRTWHAVCTAGAADFFLKSDDSFYLLRDLKIVLSKRSFGNITRNSHVFFDHFDRIHAGKNTGYLFLIPKPS